jgi:tetratricopeptide (TPR) repeat protein
LQIGDQAGSNYARARRSRQPILIAKFEPPWQHTKIVRLCHDAQAHFDLGYFYNAMGRHGEAFAPLVRATNLDPTFAEAFYGIGYAYLRGEEFEKSFSYLRSAVRLKPDYAEAIYGLGQVYARQGKTDLANEQLRKLNTLDAKLARKLEKEMQSAPTTTITTASTQPTTPSQRATNRGRPRGGNSRADPTTSN